MGAHRLTGFIASVGFRVADSLGLGLRDLLGVRILRFGGSGLVRSSKIYWVLAFGALKSIYNKVALEEP